MANYYCIDSVGFTLKRLILLSVCLFFAVFSSQAAHAEKGAVQLVNRAGTSINKGNLSRDVRYPTYSLAISMATSSESDGLGAEISNVVSVSHSTFYTQNKDTLKFPLIAKAPYQLFEPMFLYDVCFFSYTVFRPCFAAGISALYLRHNANNYQMYTAFPGQTRFQIVTRAGFILELGATLRRFSFRSEGTVGWNQDLSVFLGMGLTFY